MKRPLPRATFVRPSLLLAGVVCGTVLLSTAGRAQFADGPITARSVSGQIIVTAPSQFSPLLHRNDFATNSDYIRLDPALLAISAERFKGAVWQQLGLKPDAPWVGKIYLTLRPARTPDDTVTLVAGQFLQGWGCRVELPDLVSLPRYGRGLATAVLLELASRNSKDPSHLAEIPAWLADGMAQQAFASDSDRIILTLPSKVMNGVPQSRMNKKARGVDIFADARTTLQSSPALTYDQLCWPDDGQVNDRDGGAYLASAQVFTGELLALKNGPAKMRDFLARLPGCLNWQTAFLAAYQEDFKRPLDIEKWWSLRVVRFALRDPGPHWTTTASRERLDALLSIPVDYRNSSNSLPLHTQISLQSAIRNFSTAQRAQVLQTRLRDLELAQFRLAQPYAGLAGGYAAALAGFLGEGQVKTGPTPLSKHSTPMRRTVSVPVTLKKLDLLDQQRRAAESTATVDMLPSKLNRKTP